jgi:GNAT superfamily N-acetyltransferase
MNERDALDGDAVEDLRVQRVAPQRLHELRRRVLRSNNPAISVADPRDEDDAAVHFAGLLGERVVVSASFYPDESPVDPRLPTYQLRYMATDFDVQGRGYGSRVLAEAEVFLRSRGARQLWANGRDTALGFYEVTGWRVVAGSDHLSPETQLPHHVIVKRLEDAN